jgi:hypothetical protein
MAPQRTPGEPFRSVIANGDIRSEQPIESTPAKKGR